jgi:putative membrane protein
MKNRNLIQLVGAASVVALLGAAPAHAQTTTNKDAASATAEARVSSGDRELMEDIAHANLAEIDTGKLALEKSQNPEVRKFAQMMIDDHTKAQQELQTLAQSKGITLPAETDVQHKTMATALKLLSGNTFDSQYISRVGVGDHERAEKLLDKTIKETSDADLKTYAQKTIKSVQHHLSMAQGMEKTKK